MAHYLKEELNRLIQTDISIFEFLEHAALDGMWYWDIEQPENEWMDSDFWNLFGYDASEKKHLASEWQDMIFEEDLRTALENFKKHLADPDHPYDQLVRYRHKNGSTVWVRCRGMAIRDGNGKPIRMLGAHNDMTVQMQTQKALERVCHELKENNAALTHSNKRYEQLYENMQDGFVVTTMEGRIIAINQVFADILGFPKQALIGRHYSQVADPFTNDDVLQQHLEELKQKGFTNWFEQAYRHHDGHEIPVEIRIYRVRNFDRDQDAMWAIIRDLTQKKEDERKSRLQENILAQQNKLASMGEMIGAISHQWRQPLNIVNGVLMNILDAYKLNELSEAYLREQLEIAQRHTLYMSQTIDDFRSFTHPTHKKSRFNINDIFRTVKEIVAAQMRYHKIDFQAVSAQEGITLYGRSNELMQVIINLVNNAKDAIMEAREMRDQEGRIVLKAFEDDHHVVITVSDNGSGILPELQQRIFEPYFTTKDNSKGSGVGLYLGQSIIQKSFDGTLTLTSSSEAETVFAISIPKSET